MSRIIVQHVNNGVRCGRFMGLITDIGRICTLTNMCNHLFILVETHNVRLDLFQHKKYETGTSHVCQPKVIQSSGNVRTLVYSNHFIAQEMKKY